MTRAVAGVVAHPAGGFALGATQALPTGPAGADQTDMVVLRLDDQGNPLWMRAYGDNTLDERLSGFALTPDGGFLIVGGGPQAGTIRVSRTRSDGTIDGCPSAATQAFVGPGVVTSQISYVPVADATDTVPDYHALVLPLFPVVEAVCGTTCTTVGGTFGNGVPGTGSVTPSLTPIDGACLGWVPELRIEDARGGAFAALGFGFTTTTTPLLGGTLYLDPATMFTATSLLSGPSGVPGVGSWTLPLQADWTSFIGITLYAQAFVLDPSSPSGVAMSNAASVTAQ